MKSKDSIEEEDINEMIEGKQEIDIFEDHIVRMPKFWNWQYLGEIFSIFRELWEI